MKKRLNRLTIALWIIAALVLATEVWIFANTYRWQNLGTMGFLENFWQLVRSGLVSASGLVAFGAMIELLDTIRWNALSPDTKAAEMGRPSIWRRAKHWPHPAQEQQ